MHHISKVEVEGFWESYDFDLTLYPQVTFVIGQNGTGKTTLINLLAAALTADFRTLDLIPFKKITIELSVKEKGSAPKIIVSKKKQKDRPFAIIEYRVVPGNGQNELKFSLEEIEEQFAVRANVPRRTLNDYYRHMSSGVLARLQDLVQVNWLSVHRAPVTDNLREERSYDSSVDQRLEAISNQLVRYFATLSREKDDEIRSFQETIFVSLLDPGTAAIGFFDKERFGKLTEFRAALTNIFSELHVAAHTESLIERFVTQAEQIKPRLDGGLHMDDLIVLMSLRRIELVVDRWNLLQKRINEVFLPRHRWMSIVDELFQRKKLKLTNANELAFESRSGKLLSPRMLSSGEKQLLILLSETLLQRGAPAVFIADEPELSLHVTWQEKLVSSLRTLNPSAQIIFATHSPDIVGALSSNAIDMESLIP